MSLVFPMAAYVLFIMAIGVFNFITRFKGVRSGEIPFKYYKAYQGDLPQKAIVVGRHYDNQFELPMLFFITCAVHMIVGRLDTLTLVLAWGFVATRGLHSYIHLGTNKVLYRAAAFFAGWLTIAGLWIQLVVSAIH